MYCRSCICSHTLKIVLESSRMTVLDTHSFGSNSGIPENSLLCVKQFQQTLVHKGSSTLRFLQIHLIGMNIVCRPLFNPGLVQVTIWTRNFFIQRLLKLLSTLSGTDHISLMYKTPNTSVTKKTSQLSLGLFRGQSIAEICFAMTIAGSRSIVPFLPRSPSSQWLFVLPPSLKAPMLHTSSHKLPWRRLSPRYLRHAAPFHQRRRDTRETPEILPIEIAWSFTLVQRPPMPAPPHSNLISLCVFDFPDR